MVLQAFLPPETVCIVCQELNVQPTKVIPTVTCYQWVDWARWNSDCRSIFSRTNSKFSATGTFPTFGPGKSCILLYRYDAHMQHNKPDAPVRIHEEMQATDPRN